MALNETYQSRPIALNDLYDHVNHMKETLQDGRFLSSMTLSCFIQQNILYNKQQGLSSSSSLVRY